MTRPSSVLEILLRGRGVCARDVGNVRGNARIRAGGDLELGAWSSTIPCGVEDALRVSV